MKRTKIAAIDVGTTKICTVMADVDDNKNIRILGYGIVPSEGLERGLITNNKTAATSITQSIKKAEKMAGCRLRSAFVNVAGTHMQSQNSRGVVSIPHNNELVRTTDQRRALDVAKNVEVPSERRLLHVIPRSYTLDGQPINNPVGLYGFRLDVETHIVTADSISVQNLTKCITGLGIGIDGLVLTSLASAEAVLTEDERQDGVVLADIGGVTTDVAVYRNGNVSYTSSLPIGGCHITNDIAIGMGLSIELAEEIKLKYGNILPSDNIDVTVTEQGYSISCHDLYEIIYARIEELFRLILLRLPESNTQVIPSGLVITGGSANLPGITRIGREVARLPVRAGTPLNLDNHSDTLSDPSYATGIGLLYWKLMNGSSQAGNFSRSGWQILLPKWLGYFRRQKIAAPQN